VGNRITEHDTNPPLVLASQSPRRKEILSLLGTSFRVVPPDIDETPRPAEPARAYVVRMAREKAAQVADRLSSSIVLSADTIVTVDEEIFGKPVSEADAVRMLHRLSGRSHVVFTAVCVVHLDGNKNLEGLEATGVWFDPMTDEQIMDYIHRENVMDKAGAYAIQGYAAVYIPRISGNYFNVMGLPLPLVHNLLCRISS
jgi:septum formation protein